MATDIEIRDEILGQLYAVRGSGMNSRALDRIGKAARSGGLEVTDAEVRREAEYLLEAGLIKLVPDPADGTAIRYKLTQAGWDAAKMKGLV